MFPHRPCFALCLALTVPAAGAGFPSQNVTFLSNVPLEAFPSNPISGNDCWGYVSSSGREYALLGMYTGIGVVEITNPTAPVIVAEVLHTGSNWGDIRVYGHYAYAVNEAAGGIYVIDLQNVDSGVVSVVTQVTEAGLDRSHNVSIDEQSGFLYLAGSNLSNGRLVVFDLCDPANPVLAGQLDESQGDYVHDCQIVTYDSGPYAGQQICFASVGAFGLDVYDVTDKANMVRLSRTAYAHLSYAHQAWPSADLEHLYLDDELDSVNETVVFDVSDLTAPTVASTYSSGIQAGDHNLFVHEGYIYEAEYYGGLRVFDAADPLNPVQVGWFDTYPESDDSGFNGAWGVYPFFPSGNVIISTKDRGLFVVRPGPAPIAFDFTAGVPDLIGAGSYTIEVTGQDGFAVAPSSPTLHYDAGDGFVEVPLVSLGGNAYGAQFGSLECGATVRFYLSAVTTAGWLLTDPPSAPDENYLALAGADATVPVDDHLEVVSGWFVGAAGDNATLGVWERVDPIGTESQPENDHTPDPGSLCYVTGQGLQFGGEGDADVDGGSTTLRSPRLDATGTQEAVISFWLWYANDFFQIDADEGNTPPDDVFRVDVSDDVGATWSNVYTIGPSGEGTSGEWTFYAFRVADFVEPTDQVIVRFVASDTGHLHIVEAAVDDLRLTQLTCAAAVPGDVDGDGFVGIDDFLALLSAWGVCADPCPPCAADFDGDCEVEVDDFLIVLANWST